MSNQFKVKNTLDQENKHKVAPGKNLQSNNNENDLAGHKKRQRPLSGPLNKRVRVPLAGKDQNSGTLSLQRSKSSLAASNFVSDNNRRPLSAGVSLKPTLTKSNSSLGFTHVPASTRAQSSARNTDPHKNTLLPPSDAHRELELVPRFATDSLKKKSPPPLQLLTTKLQSTFSENTRALHASFAPIGTQKLGDPIKNDRNELLQQLAESDIEHVTHQDVPEATYVPLDGSELGEEDLEFIRTGVRPAALETVVDLSFESTDTQTEDTTTATQNADLERELGTHVGLLTDDLALMLEW